MSRFIFRGLVVCIAIGAIYIFLNIPLIINHFFPQKSINVLAWPSLIDEEYFEEFEQTTGIKVYLTYFDSYEELVIKIRAGGGDYDLVMASDYTVKTLMKDDLAKKIDREKINFWDNLYPSLLGLYHDPLNEYTIPFTWEIYGIGIMTDYFKDEMPPATWGLLFDDKLAPPRVGMLDDAREVISIAAYYLFGKKETLAEEDLIKIKNLLTNQKKRVAMYTDLRTDYLLISGAAPVVLGLSSYIYYAMRQHDNVRFLIPKEGSFILVEAWMLPKTTQKEDLVYEFLNYLYQPDVLRKYADRYNFFPASKGVASHDNRFFLAPVPSLLSRLRFFTYDIPEQQLRNIWINLKS